MGNLQDRPQILGSHQLVGELGLGMVVGRDMLEEVAVGILVLQLGSRLVGVHSLLLVGVGLLLWDNHRQVGRLLQEDKLAVPGNLGLHDALGLHDVLGLHDAHVVQGASQGLRLEEASPFSAVF